MSDNGNYDESDIDVHAPVGCEKCGSLNLQLASADYVSISAGLRRVFWTKCLDCGHLETEDYDYFEGS